LAAVDGVRERIEIEAPPARIWAVVHQDIANVPMWAQSLVSTEVIGGGRLRVGSELRYVARLPVGNTAELRLMVDRYEEFKRCAGTLSATAMKGRWEWTYQQRRGVTSVVYETRVRVGALFRLVANAVEERIRDDVRNDLVALKQYVESGKGPR
jgi:uncharacterized membrane protein